MGQAWDKLTDDGWGNHLLSAGIAGLYPGSRAIGQAIKWGAGGAYSLMPNGRTLDYVADAPYLGPDGMAPIGIQFHGPDSTRARGF